MFKNQRPQSTPRPIIIIDLGDEPRQRLPQLAGLQLEVFDLRGSAFKLDRTIGHNSEKRRPPVIVIVEDCDGIARKRNVKREFLPEKLSCIWKSCANKGQCSHDEMQLFDDVLVSAS